MKDRVRAVWLVVAVVTGLAVPATADERAQTPQVAGMVITESTMPFGATWDTLYGILDANPNISVVSVIDHAANARGAGLDLPPNRSIWFGNPNIGTPLMQESPAAGLDLPLKMLVWEEGGLTYVGYNSVEWLAARHGLSPSPQLETIRNALRTIAGAATGTAVDDTQGPGRGALQRDPGLVTVGSHFDADETLDRLIAAIGASPANVAFTVDHAANAASVGLDLAPNTVVVFGNPRLGTPLMREAATAGIDLPLKVLVFEDDDGNASITYPSMRSLSRRHHFGGERSLGAEIERALKNLVAAATGT